MTEPYYADDVTVHHGDARDVLATLPDASFDACVTDPPYGLEFMGKDWDAPWAKRAGLGGNTAGLGEVEMADGATRLARPNYYGSPNPTCRNCGGLKRGSDTKKSQKACRCDAPRASRFYYTAKAAPDERPRVNGISHPTVKPLDLIRWLVRLVTPPGGLVLDPFAGSGTTGEACIIEGFRCVLIEREADYLPLIRARLSKPIQPVLEMST